MNILKNNISKRRPVNLFYLELIISLLFFIISGAVILKVFAAADNNSRLSYEKENAIVCAQSIAEVYSETGNAVETLSTVVGDNVVICEGEDKYMLTLDDKFHSADDGRIILRATEEREKKVSGNLSHLSISFVSDNTELFSFVCSAYISDGGKANEE